MWISKGELIFRQGETGDLFHLKSGLLKVTRYDAEGNNKLLNILLPGEIFPHHSLISPKEYHGTVSALIDSEVTQIPADQWYTSLNEKPDTYKKVASILQENLRKMQKHIEMTTLPSKKRIPLFREWISLYCPDYPLEKILTQEEIGQFLGLSRETTNRLLRNQA